MIEVPIYWANAVLMIKPGSMLEVLSSDRIHLVLNVEFAGDETSGNSYYKSRYPEELKWFFKYDINGLQSLNCSYAILSAIDPEDIAASVCGIEDVN